MDEVKAIDRIARKLIDIRIDEDIVAEARVRQQEEEECDNALGTMSSIASLSPSSSMSDIIAPALSIAEDPGPKGKGPEPEGKGKGKERKGQGKERTVNVNFTTVLRRIYVQAMKN